MRAVGRHRLGDDDAMRLLPRLLVPLVVAGSVAACSSSGGALGRAESTGILTVGAVESPPAVVPSEGGEVTGAAADLVDGYARSIEAHPTWRVGGSPDLAAAVGRGEVDVIIGVPAGEVPDGMTAVGEGATTMLVADDEPQLRDSLRDWLEST